MIPKAHLIHAATSALRLPFEVVAEPIGQCLREVDLGDAIFHRQISDRPGHSLQATRRPGTQPMGREDSEQVRTFLGTVVRKGADLGIADFGVGHGGIPISIGLPSSRNKDTRPNVRGRLSVPSLGSEQRFGGNSAQCHSQIKPVEQRARDPGPIRLDLSRRAPTPAVALIEVAARTRIHRRDAEEVGRKPASSACSDEMNASLFHRLPQDLKSPPIEFRKLIQEEHSMMGKREFPRPKRLTSAA